MAGAGYKLFNTGDVLTAAQVNTYLMEQSIMVFASAAARTTALSGVLAEGMVSYLKDTDVVEIYTGAAWVSLDDPNAVQNAGYFAAGKNKIINGDFLINQRGFTSTTTSNVYTFDRWVTRAVDGTSTFTAQTFTPGAAPVTGYESANYLDLASTGQTLTSARTWIGQFIEDVRTFANQTVTISFWAKASSGTPTVAAFPVQVFGSGGSSAVNGTGNKVTISTSWARYSVTVSVNSISGKTIGTGSYLAIWLSTSSGSDWNTQTGTQGIQTATISIWGVQVEAGSVATAFQTATGTLQGELAACQRYYVRFIGDGLNDVLGTTGFGSATTQAVIPFVFPVQMRTAASAIESSTVEVTDLVNEFAITITLGTNSTSFTGIANCAATGLTQFRPYFVRNDNNAAGYVAFTAEL